MNIRLPFEQKSNPVLEGNPRNINYKYFFNRKVAFLKEADAVALFPGGFGTLDEAMETLTLVQTGKRNPLPLVLLEEPGGSYWSGWIRFLTDELLSRGNISKTDFNLFDLVYSAEDAVSKIERFYFRYHSLRYVEGQLVLRLNAPLDQDKVTALKAKFSDMLTPGGDLRLSGPLPVEMDEPEIAQLPRLIVDFNRHDFGLLKALIDDINNH